jgi:HK97 family phage prohead protease
MEKLVQKTFVLRGDGPEFVLSDNSKDRMGDVIEADGWELGEFRQNPIALFNHNKFEPIGTWEKVRVEGNRLLGKLRMAAKGTSARIDELIALVDQRVLRAVSVGFRSLERSELPDGGIRFIRQSLLEVSLVSIPANANAVQLMRSLNISSGTISAVVGGHAPGHRVMHSLDPATRARETRARALATLARLRAADEQPEAGRIEAACRARLAEWGRNQ